MPGSRSVAGREQTETIAIIGIGCRFPGEGNGPESYWKLLCDGVDAISEIPQDRWNIEEFYDPTPGLPGKTYSCWAGFVKGVDQFEPECFGISPREANRMDPQQRLLLEVAREAIEDACLPMEQMAGSNTGVFVGISTTDYTQIQSSFDVRGVDGYSATGEAFSIAANRVSYCFDLRGPSVAVDTACSSSLVAANLACRSIWNGECTMALAGGVNVILNPWPFLAFSAATMLSPDGRCKAFDASANGFVRSEGAGLVFLKPLSKALSDGDSVYALIVASAVNQDGRTNGITLPNGTAQETLIREACQRAGIRPGEVDYVEAHGTGTPVGDPIEAAALGRALSARRPKGRHVVIGSAKTNIGHLEAASGIAGLIKVALMLKHRKIPRNLHFVEPNPNIPFEELRLHVPCSLESWPQDSRPGIAGVNSFGMGGTNAHVLLKEYREEHARARNRTPPPWLLPLSGRTPEALQSLAQSYMEFFRGDRRSLPDVCYTASTGRSHLEHRLALVVRAREDLEELLKAYLEGEKRPGMVTGKVVHGRIPKVVFVFSGQGPQWWGMGRQLLEKEPVFRRTIEECHQLLLQYADWSLLEELSRDEDTSRIQETAIAQPAIFSLQVALAALWRSRGIEPEAVVGHSVGEVAAACTAGALTLPDAVKVIFHRGRCMDRTSSRGRMLAVALSRDDALETISGYEDRVSLAAVNGPLSATLSGDPAVLEEISETLSAKKVFCRLLQVSYAFHSPQMEPIRTPLLKCLEGITAGPTSLPLVSTVTGKLVEGTELGSDYWWHNVRKTVLFAEAMRVLIEKGYDSFLELSPHPVLSSAMSDLAAHAGRNCTVAHSLHRNEDDGAQMLAGFGALYTAGYPVRWEKLWPEGGERVRLPRYPWQRERYWRESRESMALRLGKSRHPLLGRRQSSAHPTWQNVLDRRVVKYLQEHRVRGQALFPAAGYVELALGAACDALGTEACILEDLQFHKPLFLPDTTEDPEIQTIVQPSDDSFVIYSRPSGSESSWTLYCTGYMRVQPGDRSTNMDLDAIRSHLGAGVSPDECYEGFIAIGLDYGPSFQGMQKLWRGDREALGQVAIANGLERDVERYRFHPALLDGCFQVLLAAVPDEKDTRKCLYLPVMIERARFYGPPSHRVWSHVKLTNIDAKILDGDIYVYDEKGRLCMELGGFRCQAVESRPAEASDELQNCLYEIGWYEKLGTEGVPAVRSSDYLPTSGDIVASVMEEVWGSRDKESWRETISTVTERLDSLAMGYLWRAVQGLYGPVELRDSISIDRLMERMKIAPRYRRFMQRCVHIFQEAGCLTKAADEERWSVCALPSDQDPQELWRETLPLFPDFFAELSLIGRCGSHLAAVLQDEIDPLQLIFPDASATTAEHLYQDSPSIRLYNVMVQRALALVLGRLPEGRRIQLLEVGAGTGGMSTYVLPLLPENRTRYVFSDVSNLFFGMAEQKFHAYPFIEFQMLDIERDPMEQGYDRHSFDVILASHVLHATGDLRHTLENILELLTPEGLLIFLEVEKPPYWIDLVFGLTEGWWKFRDTEFRPDHPLVRRDTWNKIMSQVGFRDVEGISLFTEQSRFGQVMMLGRGPRGSRFEDGTAREPRESGQTQGPGGSWLIFADRSGVGQRLAQLLERGGESSLLVYPGERFESISPGRFTISPHEPEDMEGLLRAVLKFHPACRGAIHLWSLDAPAPRDTTVDSLRQAEASGCHTILHYIQALNTLEEVEGLGRLVLVTRGAQFAESEDATVSIGQAPLVGLGRVIVNEHPAIQCKMIDLGFPPEENEVELLIEELSTEDQEQEVALRKRTRLVPRLERSVRRKVAVSSKDSDRAFRLQISGSGVIDNLTLRETKRCAPGPGQVEIEVCAAALNFRDILKALGLYPRDGGDYLLLGDECAGRVASVGGGVRDLKEGDEVIAIAPASFGSHVTTVQELVVRKPPHLTFTEAVTIPIAFLTSYYALHHLARLSAGERVLIHSAAGGVGLAAVQIAQHAGAEVFATVGNPEKRELLELLGVRHIMDSRSLSFADEIMSVTKNEGVDIVLNSLAGKSILKGLSCLAPYGRFVELGKRDIYQNNKLGLWAFRKNLSYAAVDLGRLMADKPAFIRSLLCELLRAIEDRSLYPLPHRVFGVSHIVDAFRYMARGRHVGKIVIDMQDDRDVLVEPLRDAGVAFDPDAAYLVTGGFGGFGLTLAGWIVERGGRNLVLVGRTGASSEEAKETLRTLRSKGVRILEAKTDVSEEKEVALLLHEVEREMPPLRGIFHAAMVLDDGVMVQLTRDRFEKVTGPKVAGAWNLHAHTLNRDLDFFVLFSSASALVGNQGQANYVAANTFLDLFANYRRSLGLPALSVNWGGLTDVGYIARNQQISQLLERRGIQGMSPKHAMQALGEVLTRGPAQMGVMQMDWQKWAKSLPKPDHRLSLLVGDHHLEQQGDGEGIRIREALLQGEEGKRQEIVQAYVSEQVAKVLRISAVKLDVDRPLNELGFDSLMGFELKNRLESDLGFSLPSGELLQGPSIDRLATAVLERLGNAESRLSETARLSQEPEQAHDAQGLSPE